MSRTLMYLVCAVFVLGLSARAPAQVQVAEELLVDLRAEDLDYGEAAAWPNRGSLADFTAVGAPLVEDIGGLKAVTFDGTGYFEGPTSVPGIEGAGTRSMEVWAYNPAIPGEETILSWSHRGGPEGSNMSFNYGNDTRWGAMGHWGGDTHDMGWWGSHGPAPAANRWWHVVYTYDGTAARVYVNGTQESVRDPIALDTYAGNIIRVATQADGTGANADTAFNFTGSIAEVRIHDGVLTAAQIKENFQLGGPKKAHSPDPADGAIGVAMPLLQWSGGNTAQWHDVYLGTTPDLGPADLATRNPVTVAMYYHILGLDPGQTYYWRVDEVEADGTIHTGVVWSFTAMSLTAFAPTPPGGAKFQDPNTNLSWIAGKTAQTHDVYFGTDETAVAEGSGDTFQGNQIVPEFDPGLLAVGTTYYWRVDEIDAGGAKLTGEVWSFTTVPEIAVYDPNLVGWWKFDEGQGTLAVDWSGLGNHGDIRGGTKWVDGYDGGALSLDGIDGYVALPIGTVLASLDSTTITTWVNFSNAGGIWQRILDFGNNTTVYMFLTPRTGTAGPMRFAITIEGNAAGAEQMIDSSSTLPSGWHHVAVTIGGGGLVLYLDGQVAASGATSVLPSDLGETRNNWIGRSQYGADAYFRGSVDDFRIYDFAMTAEEIPETMRGDPTLAWGPQPARGAVVDIRDIASLEWSAGDTAVQHDLYFGTDEDAVANADPDSAEYKGRQTGTSYSLAGLVQFGGGAYFWRIDEVEADMETVRTGRLWDLTVPDFLIADDFESYTDNMDDGEAVFQTWIDGWENGTGSTVGYLTSINGTFGETQIVHSGKQSMPLEYNNVNTPYYSETERTWTTPQNWTAYDGDTLTLYVRGQSTNDATQALYVGLEDNAGNIAVENLDPAALATAQWTELNVPLSDFDGVNAAAVKKMIIGVGDRDAPTPGTAGLIFIDDIRVTKPAPAVGTQ